ncbi:MAG: alcohol dehydrogenase catalytic domain-containing protein [Eubacteriales bacterium]|nr:alcohol dehydrogenase catalytic domain-containing protein [Eubacteriales bacterium]
MKTVRYHGIGDVRCENISKPIPKSGEALIKVSYAGICGSDMHIYNKGMFVEIVPNPMGHEFVGVIEEMADGFGEEGQEWKVGDIVVGNPMVVCGSCEGCKAELPNTCEHIGFIGEVSQGCFAEYICMKAEDLIQLPKEFEKKDILLERIALTEPLAVALNMAERAGLADQPKDQTPAIIGAGPIALLLLAVAKQIYHIPKVVLTGRSQKRLSIAEELGATVLPSITEKTDGKGYSLIFETAGKEATISMSMEAASPGGKICVVSVFEDIFPVDLNILVGKQLTLVGSNAYEIRHLKEAMRLLADGSINPDCIITSIVEPEQCKESFDSLNEKDKTQAKILFKMS